MNPYISPPISSDPGSSPLDWTNILAVLLAVAYGLLVGALIQSILLLPIGPRP